MSSPDPPPYNMYNTMALKAVGGKHSGLTMTVSTLQLGICSLYAGLLWLSNFNPVTLLGLQAPTKMPKPETTKQDIIDTLPVGFCAAAAHSAGVFCLGADPLFGQIVKAGEPVLSADREHRLLRQAAVAGQGGVPLLHRGRRRLRLAQEGRPASTTSSSTSAPSSSA